MAPGMYNDPVTFGSDYDDTITGSTGWGIMSLRPTTFSLPGGDEVSLGGNGDIIK